MCHGGAIGLSSRSDEMMVAVRFNARGWAPTTIERRGATLEGRGVGQRGSSVAPPRLGGFGHGQPWIEIHGDHRITAPRCGKESGLGVLSWRVYGGEYI